MNKLYDCIIVGGGPAGLTSALYCVRNGKTALVIEKSGFGGQITSSPKVENFPGTLQMSGNQFADSFMDQVMAHGVDLELAEAVKIEDLGATKKVYTDDGSVYESKTLILATGVKHRLLGLEGEEEHIGNGISFCAVCDGDFYAGKDVIVIGGGNSAFQEAIMLAGKCKSAIILQDLDFYTADKALQNVFFSCENTKAMCSLKVVSLIIQEGELKGVKAINNKTGEELNIFADGIFVAIGLIPQNEIFAKLTDLDQRGYFASGEDCLTKTKGIFVAGDCRAKSVRQLTTAVGDGACAAIAACNYIDAK